MAKNQDPPKPAESDSETDDGSTEEGSSESEPEPEQTQITKKPPPLPPATVKKPLPETSSKTHQPKPASSSDSPDPPTKSSGGARKPTPTPASSEPVKSEKSTAAKRPAEEKESDAERREKKKRKQLESATDDSKKSPSSRFWSEDDEIVVLKGMIDYAAAKKPDASLVGWAGVNEFRKFIKDDLGADVSTERLQDKIRRMKKKYGINRGKEEEGKELGLRTHELKVYELSKRVWGDESGKKIVGSEKVKGSLAKKIRSKNADAIANVEFGVVNGNVDELLVSENVSLNDVGEKLVGSPKVNGSLVKKTKTEKADEDVKNVGVVNGNLDKLLGLDAVSLKDVSMESRILRIGAEMFEGGHGVERESEREWKKLKVEAMELYVKHLELMTAQTKLVLDVLKSDK